MIVTIRRAVESDGALVFVVSDEDSEFARASRITDALHYASELLHGPGTLGPRGTVWNLMRAIEETGYNPQGGAEPFELDDDGPICDGEFAGPNACTCGDPRSHTDG